MELIRSRGTCLHRASASQTQLAQRLDWSVAGFGNRGGITREHRACGHLRVDPIRLPASAAAVSIGLVNLDHVQSSSPQMPTQPGTPRRGAFDTDREDLTEAGHPARQIPIAARCGRERRGVELAAELIEDATTWKSL